MCKGSMGFVKVLADVLCDSTDEIAASSYHKNMRLNCIWLYSLPGYTFCLGTARLLCAPQPPQAMREATSCTRRSSSRKPWRCTTRSAGRMLVAASPTEA